MTLSALATVWIPSQNYHAGRLRAIRGICLHSTQSPCEVGRAVSTLRTLAPASIQASTHYACDPEIIGAGVEEQDTAWAAPSFNADGIQIEQCGFAEFGSGAIPLGVSSYLDTWHDYYGGAWPDWHDAAPWKMITTRVVPLAADICRRNNIPAMALTPSRLADPSARGITQHVWCSTAFGGTHWDCGPNYPIDEVITLVTAQLLGIPTTPGTEDEPMKLVYSDNGAIYFVGGNSKAEVVGQPATPGGADAWTNTKWGLDRLVEYGVVDEVINPPKGSANSPKGGVPQGALNTIPNK